MKCKRIIQKFLETDNFNSLPVKLQIHMFFCRTCRMEIRFLTDVFNSFRDHAPFEMERDLTGVIMERILQQEINNDISVSVFKWIAVWIIILAGIFLLPFNEQFLWLIKYFGMNLELPINIVMGLFISIYSIFYIGTHLNHFKRFLDYLKHIIKHYQ